MKVLTNECVACGERRVESTMVYDTANDKYFCNDECQKDYWEKNK